jgi:type I restriction enzyme S subunit
MEDWKDYKLGDISSMKYGKLPPSSCGEKYPVWSGYRYVGKADTFNCTKGTMIVVARGVGGTGDVKIAKEDCYLTNLSISVDLDCQVCNPYFLYYKYLQKNLKYLDSGSAQSQITIDALKNLAIKLPSLDYQNLIVNALKTLDDKIECNRRINENLEQQAQALFKSWFVDFEPFKDQPFVESELGMIPQGWKLGNLFDVSEILDKYRKPLSSRDREGMDKIYPYYGATSCMDYVDNYIFDGIYTLIGEDGSVAKEDGLPYMQYVWGKLWVNNHAHILQGKNGFSTEMIHTMLSITNIGHLVTGAVQAKLSQANMQKILVAIPPVKVLDKIRPVIDELYGRIRNAEDESRRLAELRDALLPRLMSGEINVDDIKI